MQSNVHRSPIGSHKIMRKIAATKVYHKLKLRWDSGDEKSEVGIISQNYKVSFVIVNMIVLNLFYLFFFFYDAIHLSWVIYLLLLSWIKLNWIIFFSWNIYVCFSIFSFSREENTLQLPIFSWIKRARGSNEVKVLIKAASISTRSCVHAIIFFRYWSLFRTTNTQLRLSIFKYLRCNNNNNFVQFYSYLIHYFYLFCLLFQLSAIPRLIWRNRKRRNIIIPSSLSLSNGFISLDIFWYAILPCNK